MRIFGHRGARGHEPENTILSIRRAIELGARWIEIDVRAVKDRLIVFHDERMDRICGQDERIYSLSIEQIRSLDAGKGEKIPFLEEVLNELQGKAGLNIEIKDEGVESLLAQLLKESINHGWKSSDLIVSSFNHLALKRFHGLAPEIPTGLLLYGIPIDFYLSAKLCGAHSIHLSIESINSELVRKAQERGFLVFVYTVNHPKDILRMKDMGVDGIFTDYPERAIPL